MRQNVTFSVGNIAVIDKIASETDFFRFVFQNLGGKARDFIPLIKLLIWNKLDESYSIDKLPDFVHGEMLKLLGFENTFSSRTANRTLERLGERSQIILNKYQEWIQRQQLIDKNQLVDFTSTYFEGRKCPIGKLGYSRDDKRDKLQITLGISTGINGIPTMLTISEGNEQDKTHMKKILKLLQKACDKGSLFVFDCGGNSKNIREWIVKNGFFCTETKTQALQGRCEKTGPF
jgi:transposase